MYAGSLVETRKHSIDLVCYTNSFNFLRTQKEKIETSDILWNLYSKMANQYKVTLNFRFTPVSSSRGHGEEIPILRRKMNLAFQRTEEYFQINDITEYIKKTDALSLVEYLPEGKVLSAEWDPQEFQIHMIVETKRSKKQLIEDLEFASLEDGEYETTVENGWVVFTRGPVSEAYNPKIHNIQDFWCWGYSDYRSNPILVEPLIGKHLVANTILESQPV